MSITRYEIACDYPFEAEWLAEWLTKHLSDDVDRKMCVRATKADGHRLAVVVTDFRGANMLRLLHWIGKAVMPDGKNIDPRVEGYRAWNNLDGVDVRHWDSFLTR